MKTSASIFCIAFAAILSLSASKIIAQNTLQLLNGKKLSIGKVIDAGAEKITYESLSGAAKCISTLKVFSEIDANGQEKVFYKQNAEEEMLFTEPQMRSFIKGRQEARLHYYSPLALPLGVIFGVAGGVSATILPAGAPVLPMVGLFGSSFFTPSINTKKLTDPNMINDEAFVQGYIEKARGKRFTHMLIGCGISFGAVLVGVLTNSK